MTEHELRHIIETLERKAESLMGAIQNLQTAVTANTTAVQNAISALQGSGSNDAAIQAAADQINTNSQALATATPPPANP